MHVFLDLWGVLLDIEKTDIAYNRCVADILARMNGGTVATWLQAYDSAWRNYQKRLECADWDKTDWFSVVDALDRNLMAETFRAAGVELTASDPLSFARDIEHDVMASIATFYSEASVAVRTLHSEGHKLYVATQAGEWHARGALKRADFSRLIAGLFSGSSQNVSKGRKDYWTRILRKLRVDASDCASVDDRLDCLSAAASAGLLAVLVDRHGSADHKAIPYPIHAVMSSLTELPGILRPSKETTGRSMSEKV